MHVAIATPLPSLFPLKKKQEITRCVSGRGRDTNAHECSEIARGLRDGVVQSEREVFCSARMDDAKNTENDCARCEGGDKMMPVGIFLYFFLLLPRFPVFFSFCVCVCLCLSLGRDVCMRLATTLIRSGLVQNVEIKKK